MFKNYESSYRQLPVLETFQFEGDRKTNGHCTGGVAYSKTKTGVGVGVGGSTFVDC